MAKKSEKTRRDQKREQVDRGRTKGVDEEAERTFKKVKMLNWRKGTHRFSLSLKKSKNGSCREKRGFIE